MRKEAIVALVCAGLAAGAARAGGGRIYPGGVCQPVSGSQNEDTIRDQDLLWNGGVSAQFMCPIETTRIKGTKGVRLVEMRVHPAGGTLSCQVVARQGTSSSFGSSDSSSENQDVTLSLTLGERFEGSSILVRCTLPPGGRIRNYLVSE